MKKGNIPEVIGVIVSLCGAVVMAGWLLNAGAIKSILPGWVSMKFVTALTFFLSGVELYYVARFRRGRRELALVVIPIASMIILILMTSLLASTVIGVNVGIEEMFVKDAIEPIGSVTPGRPSLATIANFFLIAMAGIISIANVRGLNMALPLLGAAVAVIGLTAITGYVIDRPSLYFEFKGISSAMAAHTAILFVLCGAGTILSGRGK